MARVLPERFTSASSASLSKWSAEDFIVVPRQLAAFTDPWSVEPDRETTARIESAPDEADALGSNETGELPASSDWLWDVAPLATGYSSAKEVETLADAYWIEDFVTLPLHPASNENPFVIHFGPKTPEDIASKRARWLVSLLDVPEQRRRREYVRFFERLFGEFGHHATYNVLVKLALDERIAADTLIEACRFRLLFLEKEEWWSLRPRWGGVQRPPDGRNLLGWRPAIRLVQLCGGSPDELIDEEWLTDWLELPFGDRLSWRFVDYLEDRLSLFSAGVWEQTRADRNTDRTCDWKRSHGLSAASDFARTANLIGLKSPRKEDRVC